MNIRLLGTGAADGIPAFYSDTRVSQAARERGGKDVRSRSAALVDGHLKIDLPPDTVCQMARERLSARDWSAIIFTHSHEDHLAVDELQYGLYPFVEDEFLAFPLYGNAAVCEAIRSHYPEWPIETIETRSFEPFDHQGYRITPVKAFHQHEEDSHNLLIECGSLALLYATDTGMWPSMTWDFLAGKRLDLLVIECTEGFRGTPFDGHLDLLECVEVVSRLRQIGCLDEAARVVTTHISDRGDGTHEELAEAFAPHAIEVGYDGMSIEF